MSIAPHNTATPRIGRKGRFAAFLLVLSLCAAALPPSAPASFFVGTEPAWFWFRMPERAKRLYEKAAAIAEEDRKQGARDGANDSATQEASGAGVSVEKIRAKIVIIDRQQDASQTERRPASAK